MMIIGLISKLLPPYYQALGSDLVRRFGIKLMWRNPISHFSWQITENYEINATVPVLEPFSKEYESFFIKQPLIYLKTFKIPLKST
jgi:hypothetical protein